MSSMTPRGLSKDSGIGLVDVVSGTKLCLNSSDFL
jgi:hypothetical protein